MDILEKLEWRYATKKFDPAKKLEDVQLERILRATNLSASSYGLQPYKAIVVTDPAVREQLKAASWNQSQITDASHLIVLARNVDVDGHYVGRYIDHIARTREVERGHLTGFETVMNGKLDTLDDERKAEWTAKQTYLALGTLLAASAADGIDACPMEGFDAAAYDRILGLEEKGLRTVVIAAIGFRAADDNMQHAKKVRKPLKDFVEIV
ncbi:NAD(P)H-dependent oxidoreductase [Chitinophaga lutea]